MNLLASPQEVFGWADALMREAYTVELEGNDAAAEELKAKALRLYEAGRQMGAR